MMVVSHIELEYHLWSMLLEVLPKLLKTIDTYNKQHPRAREFASFLKSK
jgi:hypothetical protein